MRKTIQIILAIYIIGSLYAIGRTLLGLPFIEWFVLILPVIGFLFAILHAIYRMNLKRAAILFVITFFITLFMEALSVKTGFPFGHYHYTEKLGPLFLGLVPYLIPLTWFMMAYPSYVMGSRIIPLNWSRNTRIVSLSALGGVILTSWDLVMDPMMVHGQHWIWENGGLYFGIPLQNFFGWWLTAFLVYLSFSLLDRYISRDVQKQKTDIDIYVVILYGITGLGSLNGAWRLGYFGPFTFGLIAMTSWVIVAWVKMYHSKQS